MHKRNVVVTGYGAMTPFGAGVGTLMEALRLGRSGVRHMGEEWTGRVDGAVCRLAAPFPGEPDVHAIPRKIRRSMGRGALLAQLAAQEALEAAGLDRGALTSGRAGVALGNTMTSPTSLEDFFRAYLVERSIRQVPANGFFRVMDHSCAANVAAGLGLTGRVVATPAACASGAMAIGAGLELVRAGAQDVMICGGVEECHPTTSVIFDLVGASSTHFDDRPEATPAPFDRDRDGTVCGEGAAVLILEAEEWARDRGAPILGRVLGFAAGNDPSQMAQPGAEAMMRCLRTALADAAIEPADVDYVNAHATGTVQGDPSEAEAIGRVFGGNTAVSSLKGQLGHTLGASGAIESIATLEMMRQGFVLPTVNLDHVDPACSGVRHQLSHENRSIDFAVKCSFGFGGTTAALVYGGIDGSE